MVYLELVIFKKQQEKLKTLKLPFVRRIHSLDGTLFVRVSPSLYQKEGRLAKSLEKFYL